MGHQILQRVLVRMLYDPELVRRVRAEPDAVFAGLDLSDLERAQLCAIDPRAFEVDPLRRRRTLRMIADEFKISTTLALAESGRLAFVEGFFSSQEFHRAMMAREALVFAYAEFLGAAASDGRLCKPQLPGVLALETAMARCRRDLGRPVNAPPLEGPRRVAWAPGLAVISLEGNVVETIHRVEQYLFEVGLMPAVALCDDAPRLDGLPPVSSGRVHLLLRAEGREVGMTYLDASTFALLDALSTPMAESALAARFAARGIPEAAVREAVVGLVDEGLLVLSA